MLNIGCHLSISKGFLQAAKVCTKVSGNTFQYFSRNPRGGAMRAIDLDDINAYLEYAKNNNFATLLCHAPYTLNAASDKEETREFALKVFKEDINMLENFPNALYNFHPGSHVGQGVEVGIDKIVDILNQVLYPTMKTTILLETMAGKGSEIGRTFEELKQIIDRVECKDKIGVCLDTCHIFDGGYDIVNNLEGVLDEFDKVIGLDRLKAIHLNDSKNILGSHKDRHELIGQGNIGLSTFKAIINNPRLQGLPMFLETPVGDELDYKNEIELLRNNYTL
ncbi:MAG: deoxyribonuclease IV [Anaeroplasmataceae bacterium]